jgi:purine-binding chemotaxis protein CheW
MRAYGRMNRLTTALGSGVIGGQRRASGVLKNKRQKNMSWLDAGRTTIIQPGVHMHTITKTSQAAGAALGASTTKSLEFLAFTLGQEEYGIDIQKVQELRGYDAVTRIANAPEHIKGVINLRGIIVPIIDMRIKFNLGTPTYDQFTVVIILNIASRVMGMVVDSVSDVITLTPEQVKPAPEMGSVLDTDYLIGLGTLDERMLILVDLDRLMTSDDMGLAEMASA